MRKCRRYFSLDSSVWICYHWNFSSVNIVNPILYFMLSRIYVYWIERIRLSQDRVGKIFEIQFDIDTYDHHVLTRRHWWDTLGQIVMTGILTVRFGQNQIIKNFLCTDIYICTYTYIWRLVVCQKCNWTSIIIEKVLSEMKLSYNFLVSFHFHWRWHSNDISDLDVTRKYCTWFFFRTTSLNN